MEYFGDYPPYSYVYQLARYAPKAIRSYMDLWKLRDGENIVTVPRQEISCMFGPNANAFHAALRSLVDENLASVEPTKETLRIHLTDYEAMLAYV